MALLFADGFDHYSSVLHKWDTQNGSFSISAGNGRFGSAAISQSTSSEWIRKNLAVNAATLIAGASFKSTRLDGSGFHQGVMSFGDSGTTQCSIRVNSNNWQLAIYRGNGTTLVEQSGPAKVLKIGFEYYIEWKVTISDTATYEVRVNGETWLSGSGVDLQTSANSYGNEFYLGNSTVAVTVSNFFDDVYVCDTTGSANTDFLGDIKVQSRFPNGNGNYGAWSRGGTDSGTNYGQVDESTPNSDTDYVSSSTPGNIDTYAMQDLSNPTGTVKALQLCYFARKDDAGTRTVRGKVRSNVTDANGTNNNMTATYVYYRDIFETDPDTGSSWTPAGLNAAECGVEVVA